MYDLRQLVSAVGAVPTRGGGDGSVRPEPTRPVTMLEDGSSKVDRDATLDVACFIDGVQDVLTLTWVDGRPIALVHVAAGAVDVAGGPLALLEDLAIVCSAQDVAMVETLDVDVLPPIRALDSDVPPELERLVVTTTGGIREQLERTLCGHMLDHTDRGMVVVDGHIAGRPADVRVGGVVKTTRTRYLDDEAPLWTLPVGWRTAAFTIHGPDRHSSYVRMARADKGWSGGLIRVEANDPALLEPLAAHCLEQRQPAATGDRRWDVHLAPVARCEQMLRARKPALFGL